MDPTGSALDPLLRSVSSHWRVLKRRETGFDLHFQKLTQKQKSHWWLPQESWGRVVAWTRAVMVTVMVIRKSDSGYPKCIYFFNIFSMSIYSQYYFVLVSGVQHSGQTLIYFTVFCTSTASHIAITKLWIIFPCSTLCPHDYFVTSNPHFSTPSPSSPSVPTAPCPAHRPGISQPVLCIYKSVSILFVSLFCSLDSTYK